MNADDTIYDQDGKPLLLVNVQVSIEDRTEFEEFLSRLRSAEPRIPFGIYADLASIILFGREIDEPLVKLDSRETLRHYDPDFRGKKSTFGTKLVFEDSLTTLIDVWLKDLAYHWKSRKPPGTDELADTEFLRRIEKGIERRDVSVQVSSLF